MTAAKTADLPANAFGAWMAAKVSTLFQIAMSSDQIGVLAVGVPTFATASGARSSTPPPIRPDDGAAAAAQPGGSAWVVPSCDSALAADRLWKMLLDPRTFGR